MICVDIQDPWDDCIFTYMTWLNLIQKLQANIPYMDSVGIAKFGITRKPLLDNLLL